MYATVYMLNAYIMYLYVDMTSDMQLKAAGQGWEVSKSFYLGDRKVRGLFSPFVFIRVLKW